MKTEFGKKLQQARMSPFLTQAQPRFLVQGETLSYTTDVNVPDRCEATEEDRRTLVQHWDMFEDLCNEFLRGHPQFGNMRCDTNKLRRQPLYGTPDVLKVWLKRNQTFASKSGIIYPNHLKMLLDILEKLSEDGRSITIQGAQQSGKTTLNVAMMMLGPMLFMHTLVNPTPTVYCPLVLVPNKDSLYEEAKEAVKTFFALYGGVEFRNNARIIIPAYYFNKNYLWRAGAAIATDLNAYEHSVLKRSRGDVVVTADVPLKIAKRSRGMVEAERFLHHIIAEGYEPLIIIDETQYGAQNGSVLAKFVRKEFPEYGNKRLVDYCKNRGTLARIINVSATTYPCIGASADLHKLFFPLSDGYHGWNFFNGSKLDKKVNNTEPTVIHFSDLNKMFGTHLFEHMDTMAYFYPSEFKYLRGEVGALKDYDHSDYKREIYEDNLVNLINAVAAQGDDIAIRLINSNAMSRLIVDRIEDRLNCPCVIWNADTQHQRDLRTTVAATVEHKKRMYMQEHKLSNSPPIAVFVTGRARMGDPFPASVRYFLEFVNCTSSHVSLEQGFFGRACGYRKFWKEAPAGYVPDGKLKTRNDGGKLHIGIGNFVIFNDQEADRVEEYVASSGDWSVLSKPLMPKVRKVKAGTDESAAKRRMPEFICLDGDTPELQPWFTVMEKIACMLAKQPTKILKQDNAKLEIVKKKSIHPAFWKIMKKDTARHLPVFAKGRIPMPDGSTATLDWGEYESLFGYLRHNPDVCLRIYGAPTPAVTSDYLRDDGWVRSELLFDYCVTDITKEPDGSTRPPNRHLMLKKGCARTVNKGGNHTTEKVAIFRMVRVDENGELIVQRRDGGVWNKNEGVKARRAGVVLDPKHRWKLHQVIVHCDPPAVNDLPKGTVDAHVDVDGPWQGAFNTAVVSDG